MRRLIRQSAIADKPLRFLSSLVGYPVRFPRFSESLRLRRPFISPASRGPISTVRVLRCLPRIVTDRQGHARPVRCFENRILRGHGPCC
jgi:hypothetical protein